MSAAEPAERVAEEAREAEEEKLRDRYREVAEDALSRMGRGKLGYLIALAACVLLMLWGLAAWFTQLREGMGVTGLQYPMMWATYIASFVWWIGIAHSGTMISAILFLFRAPFRSAFSRAAEAMTLIAIVTAALFPVLHLGRAWRAYWLLPYPNERGLWVTFRSPLIIDVFAVVTYLIVSLLFFWLGILPDAAVVRDRARGWKRTLFGLVSLGWEGRGRQWKHYLLCYSILAGLATPLVISVHSDVAWDFALAIVPGWHSTIFPPYFVVGAIFSGLAMVLTLVLPMRSLLGLKQYVTQEKIDKIAKLVLMMSLLVTFSYVLEYFLTWYGRNEIEKINLQYKAFGPFSVQFWTFTVCNSLVPLALAFRSVRRSPPALFVIAILINVGMWLERFVIVAASLARDYLPSAWATSDYHFRPVEVGICAGSLGWFLFCFLLFVRYVPVIPIADIQRDYLTEHREKRAIRAAEAG